MKISFVYSSMTCLLTAALVAAGLLVSCVQMDDSYDASVGYLVFPELTVEASVEDPMATKAESAPIPSGVKVPDVSELTIVVTDTNGKTYDFSVGSKLTLPVGSYSITVSYGSNTLGIPYFLGSANGTIAALTEEIPSISVTMQNALVRVNVGTELAKHFTPSGKVTLTSGAVDYAVWTYVPAGTKLEATLAGTNSAGISVSKSYTVADPVAACTAYDFTADMTENMPSITLSDDISKIGAFGKRIFFSGASTVQNINDANLAMLKYEISSSADFSGSVMVTPAFSDGISYADVSTMANTYYVRAVIGNVKSSSVTVNNAFKGVAVTASHYDASGQLAGTDAKFPGLGLDALDASHIVRKLKTDGVIKFRTELKNKDSKVVRTTASDAAVDKMTVSSGWPYLPQGTGYTLDVYTYFSSNEDGASSVSVSGPTVPAPTFTVTLGTSYTSYDKYVSSGADAANACNNDTIYGISSSNTISSDLMSNANYTSSSDILLDGVKIESGDKTGLTDWRSYELKATVTFDGTTVASATKTHVITGLPYSYDFHANGNAVPSNWTKNSKVKVEAGKLTICKDGSDGYLISPRYNYSGNVSYVVEAQYYSTYGLTSSASINMYVGASSTASTTTTRDTHKVSCDANTGESHNPYSGSLNLSSKPYVFIYHNKNNEGWGAIDYLCIYEFHLKYQ